MNAFVCYWPREWVDLLAKNGDSGPLSVVYGGPHLSQPSLAKVKPGDVIYPVTILDGALHVMARMTVTALHDGDDYAKNIVGLRPERHTWDSHILDHPDEATHRTPRTCADIAAVGEGSSIKRRPFPADKLGSVTLGPKPGAEKPLKIQNGKVTTTNFSGYVRRLSEVSAPLFAKLFA